MKQEFVLNQTKPYNPEDYGLPVWKDEDHPIPQQVTQATQIIQKKQESINETKEALQLLWNNINKLYQRQLYKHTEIKELLDRYGIK